MNHRYGTLQRQRGVATLFTAVILIIGAGATALYTATTVVNQTQNSANERRSSQASAAADAAMDHALAYFNQGGPAQRDLDPFTDDDGDPDSNPIEVDYTESAPFPQAGDTALDVGGGSAAYWFDLDDGLCAPFDGEAKTALIVASGTSDDGVGARTVRQCVSSIDIFGGNAPRQPLVVRGGVGLTGNYIIINRFNNTTIWSGEKATIGMSASAATYLREQSLSVGDLTKAELEDINVGSSAASYTSEPITDRDKGSGVDTIDEDPRLGTLTGDQFFNNFFFSHREDVKNTAAHTSLSAAESITTLAASDPAANNASGVVWIDGDVTLNGGQYGLPTQPQVMIINGNVDTSGNPIIHGLLYVTGQFEASGTPTVYGSVVVEGDPAMVPAGELPVIGNGTVNLVYTPFTLDRAPNPFAGTAAPVAGTWRDW